MRQLAMCLCVWGCSVIGSYKEVCTPRCVACVCRASTQWQLHGAITVTWQLHDANSAHILY